MGGSGSESDDWFLDDELETQNLPLSIGSSHGEASTSGSRRCVLICQFVGMGFPEGMVVKAINDTGEDNEEAILETLLEYSESTSGSRRYMLICQFVGMGFSEGMVAKAIDDTGENKEAILETLLKYSSTDQKSPNECEFVTHDLQSSESENDNFYCLSDGDEEGVEHLSEKEKKLVDMGFSVEDASSAIDACGAETPITELMDFIYANQMAKAPDRPLGKQNFSNPRDNEPGSNHNLGGLSTPQKRKKLFEEEDRWERKLCSWRKNGSNKSKKGLSLREDGDKTHIPKPMIGFGVPNQPKPWFRRVLPEVAIKPPFFYYENVAWTPKGVWNTISRFLHDIEPEFVDSIYFCAAARKRGYVHNLPIKDRFPLQPMPPLTIQEALPELKKWWPSWDYRTKFNCLNTCCASAQLTERIRKALEDWDEIPPLITQKFVLYQCKKWNLVWTGKKKAAPLEPDEIEMLLGYPRDHTRGASKSDRLKALGNSFQVDTVAYHFSVLKKLFPDGIRVLSLFAGIGGAEVALHRLGIRLKAVVSVEVSEVSRGIFRSWWERTNQTGRLVEFEDVQKLNEEQLEPLIRTLGGFDLVVGGSPCNNLTGSNRVHRDGLQGKHSVLFYDYFRILQAVKDITAAYMKLELPFDLEMTK